MKRIFLTVVLVILFSSFGVASAQTINQAQIQALMSQLIQMQNQITQMQNQATTVAPTPTPAAPTVPTAPTTNPTNPPPIPGQPGWCGSAATTYPNGSTIWNGSLCFWGTAVPSNPPFPTVGHPTTWICLGTDGGPSSATCTATVVPPPPIPGICGTAARSYPNTATSYGNYTFCALGTPLPTNPPFPLCPTVGICTVDWSCLGRNGGIDAECTATKEPPISIPGICGGMATTLPPGITSWPGLSFCALGTPNPANPIFPQPSPTNGTSTTSWDCLGLNGGAPAHCIATLRYFGGGGLGTGGGLFYNNLLDEMQKQVASIANVIANLIQQENK